jgi:hypothetical protein
MGVVAGPDEACMRRGSMFSSPSQKEESPAYSALCKQSTWLQAPACVQPRVCLRMSSMRESGSTGCMLCLAPPRRLSVRPLAACEDSAALLWEGTSLLPEHMALYLGYAVTALLHRTHWSWAACASRAAGWAEGAAFPELLAGAARAIGADKCCWVQSS